jgi:alanyl-tRNA synthetase
MSSRLYYEHAYQTRFLARILEREEEDGLLAVVLDSTAFYPTSGGQPADRGTLNGQPVCDVYVRDDGAVVHLVEGELWSEEVTGEIDWRRRFDHMQQHTGQHILSQAFLHVAGAETLSFHLGDSNVTIDLDNDRLQPQQVEAAELLANRVVWENRPVRVRFASVEEAKELPLRKLPEVDGDRVRLIDIERFDLNACGGTHVRRTGEVGMIKIVRLERQRGHLRVGFLCGSRALLDYRQKNSLVNRLSATLTTGVEQVEDSVNSLRDELQAARRQLRHQENQLLDYEAERLLGGATMCDGARIVRQAFTDRDAAELRNLASRIAAAGAAVALLGSGGQRAQLILARSADGPGQMDQLLKQALPLLGEAGGGGSATFAQGGGPAAPAERVDLALARAEKLLLAQRS